MDTTHRAQKRKTNKYNGHGKQRHVRLHKTKRRGYLLISYDSYDILLDGFEEVPI